MVRREARRMCRTNEQQLVAAFVSIGKPCSRDCAITRCAGQDRTRPAAHIYPTCLYEVSFDWSYKIQARLGLRVFEGS